MYGTTFYGCAVFICKETHSPTGARSSVRLPLRDRPLGDCWVRHPYRVRCSPLEDCEDRRMNHRRGVDSVGRRMNGASSKPSHLHPTHEAVRSNGDNSCTSEGRSSTGARSAHSSMSALETGNSPRRSRCIGIADELVGIRSPPALPRE